MQMFLRANATLRHDLNDYAHALRTTVSALPRAQQLCVRVSKEARLIEALLAFGTGPQISELSHVAMQLQNLWIFREDPFPRTMGFSNEIEEARRLSGLARRGLQMVASYRDATLGAELANCFRNVEAYLEQERELLEECHSVISAYAQDLDLTRKRLRLLVAAADARLSPGVEQERAVQIFGEANALLSDWESGVPIDGRGVEILDRCLTILDEADRYAELLSAG